MHLFKGNTAKSITSVHKDSQAKLPKGWKDAQISTPAARETGSNVQCDSNHSGDGIREEWTLAISIVSNLLAESLNTCITMNCLGFSAKKLLLLLLSTFSLIFGIITLVFRHRIFNTILHSVSTAHNKQTSIERKSFTEYQITEINFDNPDFRN